MRKKSTSKGADGSFRRFVKDKGGREVRGEREAGSGLGRLALKGMV